MFSISSFIGSKFPSGIFRNYQRRVQLDGGITEAGGCVNTASGLILDASLLLIPSGYKEDVVYSEIPTDGLGDLTFTRASSGTRVNSSGLVENVPWNLLEQSNTFSTTWTNTRSTESSGYAGYDGTNNAWKLEEDSNTGTHKIQQSTTTTGVITASLYAKAAERSAVQFIIESGGSYAGANFNLADGSVQSTFSATFTLIEAKVSSVGNGWYQLSFSANLTSSAAFTIYTLNAGFNTSYAGTTGEGVYIQDAQLNTGSTAKPYFPTTDRQNVPRLTYEGGCPSLLLEPQRTNLILQSEAFGSASWSAFNASVSSNVSATLDPQGYYGADKLVEDSSSAYHDADQVQNYTAAAYTISVFAKAAGRNHIFLQHFDGITFFTSGTFNLADGTISGVGSIENYGNGWYRCSYTATTASGTGKSYINLSNGTTGNYQGDGTSGVYIWGAQLEAGSYPTSYIGPTTSAAVTRVEDRAYKTGISSLIGQTEGTGYVEFDFNAKYSSSGIMLLQLTGSAGQDMYFGVGTNNQYFYEVQNSTYQVSITGYFTTQGIKKVAFAYKQNDFVLYINGVQVGFDTTGTLPTCTEVYLGSFKPNSNYNLSSTISQAALFKTRLTNAELAAITSL